MCPVRTQSPHDQSERGQYRFGRAGALNAFGERRDKKYQKISQPWQANRANFCIYFKCPQEMRRLIYITNAIEDFNRPLRKAAKLNRSFQPMAF